MGYLDVKKALRRMEENGESANCNRRHTARKMESSSDSCGMRNVPKLELTASHSLVERDVVCQANGDHN